MKNALAKIAQQLKAPPPNDALYKITGQAVIGIEDLRQSLAKGQPEVIDELVPTAQQFKTMDEQLRNMMNVLACVAEEVKHAYPKEHECNRNVFNEKLYLVQLREALSEKQRQI